MLPPVPMSGSAGAAVAVPSPPIPPSPQELLDHGHVCRSPVPRHRAAHLPPPAASRPHPHPAPSLSLLPPLPPRNYWTSVISVVPPSLAVMLLTRNHLLRRGTTSAAAAAAAGAGPEPHALRRFHSFTGGVSGVNIKYTPKNTILYPAICTIAGIVAGLFGLGEFGRGRGRVGSGVGGWVGVGGGGQGGASSSRSLCRRISHDFRGYPLVCASFHIVLSNRAFKMCLQIVFSYCDINASPCLPMFSPPPFPHSGGGVVKAPLMLELGVLPEVATATSTTMWVNSPHTRPLVTFSRVSRTLTTPRHQYLCIHVHACMLLSLAFGPLL